MKARATWPSAIGGMIVRLRLSIVPTKALTPTSISKLQPVGPQPQEHALHGDHGYVFIEVE